MSIITTAEGSYFPNPLMSHATAENTSEFFKILREGLKGLLEEIFRSIFTGKPSQKEIDLKGRVTVLPSRGPWETFYSPLEAALARFSIPGGVDILDCIASD